MKFTRWLWAAAGGMIKQDEEALRNQVACQHLFF